MEDGGLSIALDRAERALERIERALSARSTAATDDERLREQVREAIAELDQLIRDSA